jgi:hypothetical protein
MDQFAQYKARWVVCGLTQENSVDYKETFSLVIKPAIVRVVLSIVTSKDWPIHELNVKNAFLHDNLTETVFAQQPSGFFFSITPGLCLQVTQILIWSQTSSSDLIFVVHFLLNQAWFSVFKIRYFSVFASSWYLHSILVTLC